MNTVREIKQNNLDASADIDRKDYTNFRMKIKIFHTNTNTNYTIRIVHMSNTGQFLSITVTLTEPTHCNAQSKIQLIEYWSKQF